jgi:hypothetical protein
MSEQAILNKTSLSFKDGDDTNSAFNYNSISYGSDSLLTFSTSSVSIPENVQFETNRLPTSPNDIVNKTYVDSFAAGLHLRESVVVASNVNIDPTEQLIDGVVIDGYTVSTGDRVLLKNQDSAIENGIYIVAETAPASRAPDLDSPNEAYTGVHTFVVNGETNANHGYVIHGDKDVVIGTDAMNWTQFSNPIDRNFSTGLSLSDDRRTISLDETFMSEAVKEADAAIQSELDATQSGAGLDSDGTYVAHTVSNYIDTGTNLKAVDLLLDAQVKANADAIDTEKSRAEVAETDLANKLDPSLLNNNAMVFSNSEGTALTSYSGFIYNNSGITVPNVTTTSDETKKRDIKELSDSDLIYKLRPVEYKWKDENMDQRTKYGFIAQEVLEIFPSMVTKQNGVYGIEYINLISHLVKEVQILREEVNSMNR